MFSHTHKLSLHSMKGKVPLCPDCSLETLCNSYYSIRQCLNLYSSSSLFTLLSITFLLAFISQAWFPPVSTSQQPPSSKSHLEEPHNPMSCFSHPHLQHHHILLHASLFLSILGTPGMCALSGKYTKQTAR